MNADVEKAVEVLDATSKRFTGPHFMVMKLAESKDAWQTIRQALRDQEAEIARLRAVTACTMGVGRGGGSLFVHGDFDSIKAAQSLVFRAEKADALLRSCKAVCARVVDQDGGILGGIDFHALNTAITAHLGAEHV